MIAEREQLKQLMEQWTVEFINVQSVNGTPGEVAIADKIEEKLRSFPYFHQHPENVWTKAIEKDSLGRKNVFALVKGEMGDSQKIVLLHGHIDTVTIDDYGDLKEFAKKPYELMEKLKQMVLSPETRADLESGDWLFGRGSVDMKSGVAAHLWVLKYFSENRDKFQGNILFMANPIEETTHGGIIDALDELERLKEDHGYEFVSAINTDSLSN